MSRRLHKHYTSPRERNWRCSDAWSVACSTDIDGATDVCDELETPMRQALRKAGGSLVIAVPKAFIDQNGLGEGSQVELHLLGKKMTVEVPTRPSYKLADLIAEMPAGLPRVEGWEEMPPVGLEDV